MSNRTMLSLAALPVALIGGILVLPDGLIQREYALLTRQDTVVAQQVALGKKVYEGKSGGALCMGCHGAQARGMPGAGPDLTDAAWLHGDGSPEFLKTIITTGVAKPKKSAAIMPAKGGAPLSAQQVEAVAAYISSLRRPQ